MIPRSAHSTLLRLAKGFPILAFTGPRQSGKTTLAKACFPTKPYLSLEDPDVRFLAESDPRGLLARYRDGAILDEIQRAPKLFSFLQTQVDAEVVPGAFVLTGSQQFGLLSGISQSLAGQPEQSSWLVYGGDQELRNQSVTVVPWQRLQALEGALQP